MNQSTVGSAGQSIREGGPGETPVSLATQDNSARTEERINILLVDDEPKNLTVLESILDDPTYRLVRAESGDQALLALVSTEFAVLVLDIHMPGMSGFELAQMIKRRRKTSSIPIIFLTAHYHEDRHILEGYQSGAVDYLLKPVNSTIVRSKVAIFAELHRKTRESLVANAALSAEVTERRRVQEEMRELYSKLEEKVAERTAELVQANCALQQIQAELREADLRKDQFLAMLGHELRNPLTAISNAASILQRIDADKPDVKWCREIIDRQSSLLTRLVDDLLDVSRVSRGKIQLDKRELDLAVVAQQAVESCRPYITARQHKVALTLPAEPIYVHGDPNRLIQVIGNLANNAAKYTEEGGHIGITVEGGDSATVRVRDTGRGLEPEDIPSLFDLFYQADIDLDRSEGGLGVGLALVQALVQMHGGTVEAHSAGRGRGSEFVVRLPRVLQSETTPTAAPPRPETNSIPRQRILIVDDNVDAARSLAKILEIHGHEVMLGHDGEEGISLATRHQPDVLFLDIGLPRMNGYEVCESLRRKGLTKQLIVAVTGYSQQSDRQLSAQAGFDAHLVKPVSLPALHQLLRNHATKAAEKPAPSTSDNPWK